ncbi:hypothetical protein ACPB9J_31255 [Streptomyces lavendulocolor]|uniref:hypothetical protein n=1 Tax=Streptomyces lavendulocolor TaxID=67316 RepID=UPI003C2C1C95
MTENVSALDGLNDVPWSSLRHAYAAADEVPGWLRQLNSRNSAQRNAALDQLFDSLFHQGSRSPASLAAVPFLARSALNVPAETRSGVLLLLIRLAVDWHDEYELPGTINTPAWRSLVAELNDPENLAWYDEQIAAATDPAARLHLTEMRAAEEQHTDPRDLALQCYDAVRAELPRLLTLLGATDSTTRARTAHLAACYPEEAASSVPQLLDRVTMETEPSVTAAILVAVGLLGDAGTVPHITAHLASQEPAIRWAAATALARLATGTTATVDQETVARIVRTLGEATQTSHLKGIEFNGGDLVGYSVLSLLSLAAFDVDSVLKAVAACLPLVSDRLRTTLLPPAVRVAFTAPSTGSHPAFAALPKGHQKLLESLLEAVGPSRFNRLLQEELDNCGLPDTRATLRAYVDGSG